VKFGDVLKFGAVLKFGDVVQFGHILKFGDVLPLLRLALSGTMKGPGVFEMMELIGKEYVSSSLVSFFEFCDNFIKNN
jgi:hypothetical protein